LAEKLLRGTSDANFAFDEVRWLLGRLGFDERIHGSHHVFRNRQFPRLRAVLQPEGKNAKPYQVAQVREVVLELTALEQGNG